MGRKRAAVLIGIHILIAAHLAHWQLSGSTLTPVEPSEAMKTLEQGEINAGFVFFVVSLVLTLIFGRFICGWACHLVAMQDMCGWMMKKIGIRPVAFRSRLLIYAPFALALYMFVWPTVHRIFWTDHPAPQFVAAFSTDALWETMPGIAIAIPYLLVVGFATVYFLGAKGFCTYACPYGGFFSPVDRLALGRTVMDPDKCDRNGHCTAACTSNVLVHKEIQDFGMVVDPGCMKCMDCISACPTGALSFGFAKPSIIKRAQTKRTRSRRIYDLSWPEEIAVATIFLFTFFAMRGLYSIIPMLMAMGLAGCGTFIIWKAWRTLRLANVRLHKWQLRFKGTFRPAGKAYMVFATSLMLFITHSFVINMLTRMANHDISALTLDKQALLQAIHPPIPDADRKHIERAVTRFEQAAPFWRGGIGLASNPGSDNTVALLYLAIGNTTDAEQAIRRVVKAVAPNPQMRGKALLDLARLQMLRARNEQDPQIMQAALATLERATRVSPKDAELFENYAAALLQMNRDLDGAITNMRKAVELDSENQERFMHLAPLLLMNGDVDGAIEALDEALSLAEDKQVILTRGRALLRQVGAHDRAEQWGTTP